MEVEAFGYSSSVIVRRLRFIIPLTCFLEVLLHPANSEGFAVVGFAAVIDVLRHEWFLASTSKGSLSSTAWRDAVYALLIYVLYLTQARFPALALSPVPVMELALMANPSMVKKILPTVAGLIAIRRIVLARQGLLLLHMVWPLWILAAALMALIIAGLVRQHDQAKESANTLIQRHQQLLMRVIERLFEETHVIIADAERERLEALITQLCRSGGGKLSEELSHIVACAIKEHEEVLHLFTPREKEILQGMARGYSYRQIAVHQQVSEGTVRAHAANIMQKMGVHSRRDAVHWAQQQHMLPVQPGSAPANTRQE
ncbi:LuxR C-terminal-related transcriptional regulator [Sulfobacillus sp. hq2]|uniref:helix-turn-helix transcriptional regulator n=1 Tax=Sulfobacillus TaxID=28033 RepID=UPI000CD1B6E9|nr:LuxR C-terminal-related transcriptional regulator [Sulfobacillus sp. hq2]POB12141.1 hypothetical protein CO251_01655 [Sulfobacillus sp. hq2]